MKFTPLFAAEVQMMTPPRHQPRRSGRIRSGFDFPAIRLSGIHPELYSIYQAAKTISVGDDNIVIVQL